MKFCASCSKWALPLPAIVVPVVHSCDVEGLVRVGGLCWVGLGLG